MLEIESELEEDGCCLLNDQNRFMSYPAASFLTPLTTLRV